MKYLFQFRLWFALVLALLVISDPAIAAPGFTVTPTANYTAMNSQVVTTAFKPILLTQANGLYTSAFNSWNATNAANNKWTFSFFNGGLSNTAQINVTTYNAFVNGGSGGVTIDITYTPGGATDPAVITAANGKPTATQAAWTQDILTTDKLAGSQPGNPYLDDPTGLMNTQTGVPLYPFQSQGSSFFDMPSRPATNTWLADAYLSTADFTTRKITLYGGVEWGFEVNPVPEASTMISFGLLLTLGGLAMLRRSRKTAGPNA